MNFENLFTNFKGLGLENITTPQVAKFLADLFDTALYKRTDLNFQEKQIDKVYVDNESFWKDCLTNNLYSGKTIKLQSFCLLEWLPYSPGLYYTDRAFQSREIAKYMMSANKNEYLPLGKSNMMLGGVGSVRLIPENGRYYLNATSTGTSHHGIPIITDKVTYNKLIDEIKLNGYTSVDLVGTIEILPIEKSLINYAREIPKYSLVVNSIAKTKKIDTEILVSVSAIYSDIETLGQYWSFASFNPDRKEEELKKAVDWIEQYAKRYSDGKYKILSDFDEHKSHFSSDIEFKLHNIVNGNANEKIFRETSNNYKQDNFGR